MKNSIRMAGIAVLLVIAIGQGILWAGQQADTPEQSATTLPVFATDAVRGFPFLIEKMKGRQVTLLGDASHGTDEYYAFRKWVTRHLIEESGVRVWVLEAEWDGAQMVDAYIRALLPGEKGARQMLAEAFTTWPQWVWANEEMVEFVEYLKDFNSRLPPDRMVRCYGMDMQFAVRASLRFLAGQWPEGSLLWRKYRDLYGWWLPYLDNPMLFNQAYAEGRETGSLLATELLEAIAAPSPEQHRILAMLIAAEEYYRVMSHDKYEAWNIRSRHFAWYVRSLLASREGANGIVAWAHNSHVGDMSGTDVEDTGLTSFGRLMREALGSDKVFILGSAGYSGTVLAATDWGQPPVVMTVPPAREGSVEDLLNDGGWDNPLLMWENEEQARLWSSQPMWHRGIGVTYTPEAEMPGYYLTAKIAIRYDALVFWRKTRALRQMVAP
jgi:erythromycin esterase-like protein